PADQIVGGQQRAGVIATRGELLGLAAEVDGPGDLREFVVADVVGVAVAELADGVIAPAHDGAVGPQRAGVTAASHDRGRGSADRNGRTAGRELVVADRVEVAAAELARTVGAP